MFVYSALKRVTPPYWDRIVQQSLFAFKIKIQPSEANYTIATLVLHPVNCTIPRVDYFLYEPVLIGSKVRHMHREQRIPLPLHCYDESGHIKPPLILYVLALWLCKGVLVLLLSVSMRNDTKALITLFYPNNQDWYISTIPAFFGLTGLVALSLRENLRKRQVSLLQRNIKFILGMGLLSILTIQLTQVVSQAGLFSLTAAVFILVSLSFGLYLLRSKHTRLFSRDTEG